MKPQSEVVFDPWYLEQAEKENIPVFFFNPSSGQLWYANAATLQFFDQFLPERDDPFSHFQDFLIHIHPDAIQAAVEGKQENVEILLKESGDALASRILQLVRVPPFSEVILQGRIILDHPSDWKKYTRRLSSLIPFETVLPKIGIGYYEWQANLETIFLDQKMYEIFGIAPGTRIKSLEQFNQLIHPNDRVRLNQEYQAISQLGDFSSLETTRYRIVRQNETRFIQVNRVYEIGKNGKIQRIIGLCQDVTDLKLAQKELDSHQISAELISDALIMTDQEFNIQQWNSAATAIYGWAPSEVIGKPIRQVIPTTYLKDTHEQVMKTFREKGLWQGEVIHPHKRGHPLHILSSVKALKDPDSSEIIGAIGVNRDITQRVQIEKNLRRTQARFQAFLDSSLDAFYLLEAVRNESEEIIDFKFVVVNDLAVQHLGMDRSRLEDGRVCELFPTTKSDGFFDRYKEVVETGVPSQVEFQISPEFPVPGWYQQQVIKVFDGVVIINRNITDSKLATEVLEETQKRQQMINRAAQVGVWYWDKAKNGLFWDDIMLNIYGIDRHEFKGTVEDWTSRVHPDDVEEADLSLKNSVLQNDDQDVQFRIVLPDGTIRYIKSIAVPRRNENGDLFQIIGINWDVTKEREAEEIRLQTKNLQQKNKELEQFAYVASHDLQEPLSTIKSFIRFLRKDIDQGKLDRLPVYMNYIEEVSQRMSILVKDLLDYSRIGKSSVLEKIDLNELVKEILVDYSFLISHTNAKFQIEDLPTINSYGIELRILFQNLISNALKFRHPDKEPVISIKTSIVKEEWLFSVTDNGIGIAAENHELVFVLFKRLHPRRKYEGTGIGLAHCQKIIDLLGGRLWLESELNKGSTFYFTIPITKDETETQLHTPH